MTLGHNCTEHLRDRDLVRHLVIDYPTLLRTHKLMVVQAGPGIVEDLNGDFRRYVGAARRRAACAAG